MNAHNTMTSPYHSKVRPTQNRGSLFSLVWVTELLVKESFFPENSNLPNLVDIQHLHENGK